MQRFTKADCIVLHEMLLGTAAFGGGREGSGSGLIIYYFGTEKDFCSQDKSPRLGWPMVYRGMPVLTMVSKRHVERRMTSVALPAELKARH